MVGRSLALLLSAAIVIGACGAPSPSPAATIGEPPAVSEPTESSSFGPGESPGPSSTKPAAASEPPASATPARTFPPLPESADLTPLPEPAPLAEGVAQQKAEALVRALSEAMTAEERLPLVMTALLASGIPIIDENGEAVPFQPAPEGPGLQAWQVHAIAAVDPARHARMSVDDVLGLFVEEPTPAEMDGFRQALSLDVRTAAFGADPPGQLWGWIVSARDPRGAALAMAAGETENLVLDGLQLELVLARLANDYWRQENAQAAPGTIVAARAQPVPHRYQALEAQRRHCTFSETEDTIISVAESLGSTAMGQVIEYLDDLEVPGMEVLGHVGNSLAILQFIAAYMLLTIDFEMSNPPLVRTKSTRQPGEQRQLAATLRFDTGDAQLVNCFRLLFASAGMSFSLPADGPLGLGNVSWSDRHGFDRVQFALGSDPVHAHTDDKGVAIIGIDGRPQKNDVPQTAGRVKTDAGVFLEYAIKSTSLGGDLLDAISSGSNPISIALEGLSRAKWSSASFIFPVVDWGERYLAEIVIEEKSNTGSVYFSWAGEMGVDSEGNIVGTGAGSVAIVGTLCVNIGPDGHSEPVDWRVDGTHTFAFDGRRNGDVLSLLLPNTGQSFRQTGNPGPCAVDAAFKQASAQTTLAVMGQAPIKISARPGSQTIPFGQGTNVTINLQPISD